jgi:hypothetical protein
MTIIKTSEGVIAIQQRRKISRVATYGKEAYGKNLYGNSIEQAGIYQMRRCRVGMRPIKMKFYRPTANESEIQKDGRDKFALAVAYWQSLTSEQKEVYNQRAIGKPLSGYNVALREYMLS